MCKKTMKWKDTMLSFKRENEWESEWTGVCKDEAQGQYRDFSTVVFG